MVFLFSENVPLAFSLTFQFYSTDMLKTVCVPNITIDNHILSKNSFWDFVHVVLFLLLVIELTYM